MRLRQHWIIRLVVDKEFRRNDQIFNGLSKPAAHYQFVAWIIGWQFKSDLKRNAFWIEIYKFIEFQFCSPSLSDCHKLPWIEPSASRDLSIDSPSPLQSDQFYDANYYIVDPQEEFRSKYFPSNCRKWFWQNSHCFWAQAWLDSSRCSTIDGLWGSVRSSKSFGI